MYSLYNLTAIAVSSLYQWKNIYRALAFFSGRQINVFHDALVKINLDKIAVIICKSLKNGFEWDGVMMYMMFEPPPVKRFASAAWTDAAIDDAAKTIATDAQIFVNFI